MLYKMIFLRKKTAFWIVVLLIPVLFTVIPLGITGFFLTNGFTRLPFTNAGSDAVNGYYTALKNQDYVQAYTYVDHRQVYSSLFSPNVESLGSPQDTINASSFTEAAKNMDRQQGKLTDYQIPNMSWSDKDGSYAVTVTRNGKPFYYVLTAELKGKEWKIMTIASSPYPVSFGDDSGL